MACKTDGERHRWRDSVGGRRASCSQANAAEARSSDLTKDVLLSSDLTKEQYNENDVDALRAWRRNIAHEFKYLDEADKRSLTSRVCQKDAGLHLSTTQATSYNLLKEYIGENPDEDVANGTIALVISLTGWFLTCSKEFVATIALMRAMLYMPVGETTQIELLNGEYTFVCFSKLRSFWILTVCAAKLGIVMVMLVAGTFFLGYTIELRTLLLQTVVLGYVMTVDELVYAALAPAHVKRALDSTSAFALPKVPWWRASLTVVVVVVSMVSAISGIVVPQTGILIDALDALCAGDRDFVRVLDGVGATAWGYPTFELQQEAQQPLPASARRWRSHVTEHAEQHGDGGEEPITYADWTIEKILSGDGRGPCPRYLCYNDSTVVPSPLVYAADCCLARQTHVPSVFDGSFSVKAKFNEGIVKATERCASASHRPISHHLYPPCLRASLTCTLPAGHHLALPLSRRPAPLFVAAGTRVAATFWTPRRTSLTSCRGCSETPSFEGSSSRNGGPTSSRAVDIALLKPRSAGTASASLQSVQSTLCRIATLAHQTESWPALSAPERAAATCRGLRWR